jgi:hypothetical protein
VEEPGLTSTGFCRDWLSTTGGVVFTSGTATLCFPGCSAPGSCAFCSTGLCSAGLCSAGFCTGAFCVAEPEETGPFFPRLGRALPFCEDEICDAEAKLAGSSETTASAIRIAASVERKALGHIPVLQSLDSRRHAPGEVCKRPGQAFPLCPVQLYPKDCDVSKAYARGPGKKFFYQIRILIGLQTF